MTQCNQCGAEVDNDNPEVRSALGRHADMASVPIGHLGGRTAPRRLVPISVGGSVPKHDPLRVYADLKLNLGERLSVLFWGRVMIETKVDGVIPVQHPVQQQSWVKVPDLFGRTDAPTSVWTALAE